MSDTVLAGERATFAAPAAGGCTELWQKAWHSRSVTHKQPHALSIVSPVHNCSLNPAAPSARPQRPRQPRAQRRRPTTRAAAPRQPCPAPCSRWRRPPWAWWGEGQSACGDERAPHPTTQRAPSPESLLKAGGQLPLLDVLRVLEVASPLDLVALPQRQGQGRDREGENPAVTRHRQADHVCGGPAASPRARA